MNEHPESLIERWDALSEAETRELRAHTATCVVCRLELQVLEENQARNETPDDAAAQAPWVERAMSQLGADVVALRPRKANRRTIALLVAAALMIAGVAGAAILSARKPAPEAAPVASPTSTATSATATAVSVPAPPPASAAPSASEAASTSAEPTAVSHPRPTTQESAATLFERANRARREGAPTDAMNGYRELLRRYPDSPEAATAHITLGKMLSERGDAAGALREFDLYLRKDDSGALREEAMMLRASMLGRLGRNEEERRAWQDFLQKYPASLYAPRAQKRLEELR